MKSKILMIVVAVAIAGASFYGGMLYEKSTNKCFTVGNFSNISPDQRQQLANSGLIRRNGNGAGVGAIVGQIISSDKNSITVKMSDGGSKIVFFSDSTRISKSESGTVKDLTNNAEVVVNGQTNPDGSIIAQSIQIRPLMQ